ncbi:MAG: radical SAM protein [Candidatus Nomurabacteria bacterium]|jgi:molybdenum cofactor biosynthesis enzyme MoaA|nr:radical SAM protein [Candidatus Nomurabacteria bacterium]
MSVLNFIGKILQPAVRPRLEEYINHGSCSGPVVVELDPTTSCNFQCPECINKPLINKGEISTARIRGLIAEFARCGVKGVIFIGGGEPLNHPGMSKLIPLCKDYNISVGLTTNGLLINRCKDEISEHVSWTRISVDAASQETFSIFRPSNVSNSFLKVIKNINELTEASKGIVGYSFLVIEREDIGGLLTNAHDLFRAACLAREIGCDYFEYKLMVDGNHSLVPLSPYTRSVLKEQIDMMDGLNSKSFSVISNWSAQYLLDNPSQSQPKDYTFCPAMEFRTLVTPSGIYPCPYKRGSDNFRLGSADEEFDKYWKSTDMGVAKAKVNPSRDCKFYCIRHELNLLLLSMLKKQDIAELELSENTGNERVTDDVFI